MYSHHLLQILDVLSYLHKQYILHVDIKPDNILYISSSADNIEIKITDMGVSKRLPSFEQSDEQWLMRMPGQQVTGIDDLTGLPCSPQYAPPYAREIFEKNERISRRTLRQYLPHLDLFCLGTTLAELLSSESINKSSRTISNLLNSIAPEISALLPDRRDLGRNLQFELQSL